MKNRDKWCLKTVIWLVAMAILILLFAGCSTTAALPFTGHTKHKPIQRMTQQQWRQAELKGINPYTRYHGKCYRNTMKIRQLKKIDGR